MVKNVHNQQKFSHSCWTLDFFEILTSPPPKKKAIMKLQCFIDFARPRTARTFSIMSPTINVVIYNGNYRPRKDFCREWSKCCQANFLVTYATYHVRSYSLVEEIHSNDNNDLKKYRSTIWSDNGSEIHTTLQNWQQWTVCEKMARQETYVLCQAIWFATAVNVLENLTFAPSLWSLLSVLKP